MKMYIAYLFVYRTPALPGTQAEFVEFLRLETNQPEVTTDGG